jgi:carbamoyl-phosphate synthase large subunit
MGVHTGDSITVAPIADPDRQASTRSCATRAPRRRHARRGRGDRRLQRSVRRHPATGRMVIIEMNPRVSRSSALASKATGFPIAKIAAKLAVGYTARRTQERHHRRPRPPSSRPSTTSSPRFRAGPSRNSPASRPGLTTQMKSVGEVMAIGRTFKESLKKAVRGLEIGRWLWRRWQAQGRSRGPRHRRREGSPCSRPIARRGRSGSAGRGLPPGRHRRGSLQHHLDLTAGSGNGRDCQGQAQLSIASGPSGSRHGVATPSSWALPTSQLSPHAGASRYEVRALRREGLGICRLSPRRHLRGGVRGAHALLLLRLRPRRRNAPSDKRKIVILGGGPNRIGQGIEFDYCCVPGGLRPEGRRLRDHHGQLQPETVSTDYDTSDRLFFEPLTFEHVLNIIEVEQTGGRDRAIRRPDAAQPGGRLRPPARRSWAPRPSIAWPKTASASAMWSSWTCFSRTTTPPASGEEAQAVAAAQIGYPVLVRPSFVLGGRAMEIVTTAKVSWNAT